MVAVSAAPAPTDSAALTAAAGWDGARWISPREAWDLTLSRAPSQDEGRLAVFIGHTDVTALTDLRGSRLLFRPAGVGLPAGETEVEPAPAAGSPDPFGLTPREQEVLALLRQGRTNREIADAMDRISWLIYRINDPVLRSLFMAPKNVLWMRDGIINMLAGNLRGDPRAVLPILSFKAVYHTLSWLHRRGWGPEMSEAVPKAMPLAAE